MKLPGDVSSVAELSPRSSLDNSGFGWRKTNLFVKYGRMIGSIVECELQITLMLAR